jgi:hypothetical protein
VIVLVIKAGKKRKEIKEKAEKMKVEVEAEVIEEAKVAEVKEMVGEEVKMKKTTAVIQKVFQKIEIMKIVMNMMMKIEAIIKIEIEMKRNIMIKNLIIIKIMIQEIKVLIVIIQKKGEASIDQDMVKHIREVIIMEINIITIKEMINIIMVVINIKMEGKNIINKY